MKTNKYSYKYLPHDCSCDQDKIGNNIPVVSVRSRGKRVRGIYTVDYEIKGDRGKMLGKTAKVGNVP